MRDKVARKRQTNRNQIQFMFSTLIIISWGPISAWREIIFMRRFYGTKIRLESKSNSKSKSQGEKVSMSNFDGECTRSILFSSL